jgi:hypothetical protein
MLLSSSRFLVPFRPEGIQDPGVEQESTGFWPGTCGGGCAGVVEKLAGGTFLVEGEKCLTTMMKGWRRRRRRRRRRRQRR